MRLIYKEDVDYPLSEKLPEDYRQNQFIHGIMGEVEDWNQANPFTNPFPEFLCGIIEIFPRYRQIKCEVIRLIHGLSDQIICYVKTAVNG